MVPGTTISPKSIYDFRASFTLGVDNTRCTITWSEGKVAWAESWLSMKTHITGSVQSQPQCKASNFEWAMSVGHYLDNVKGVGIYTPITNKYFEKLMQKVRKRHKGYLLSRYKVHDYMKSEEEKNNLNIFVDTIFERPDFSKILIK